MHPYIPTSDNLQLWNVSIGSTPSAPNGAIVRFVLDDNPTDPICAALRENRMGVPDAHACIFGMMKRDHVVLDLGGHIGTFGLIAAALCKEVIIVDGSPRNVGLLRTSIREHRKT